MNLRDLNKSIRFSKLAEFRQVVTPRNEKHYRELMKHLHAMELDPVNRTDPELMGEIQRRRLELRNWAEKNIKREDDGGRAQQAYKLARDQKVDYANIMFRGKEIDHNSIDYDMKDFSDMIFELHGAKYIDGTPLTDEELEEFEKTDELLDWVAEDYATQGESVKEEAPFGTGMDLVRMAVFRKFISAEEYVNFAKELKTAGEEVANSEQYADWPDGEGFGSSDGNFAIRDLMSTAGYEFDDNDTSGRFVVTKMPKKLQKLGITNVRMKQPELPLKQEGDSDGVQPADLKRMGLSTPKAYVHKDGRTVMINKKDLQKYLKKGWQKSSLRAE